VFSSLSIKKKKKKKKKKKLFPKCLSMPGLKNLELYKKIKKYKRVKYDDILEHYWKSVSKFQGIKGQNYDSNKFLSNKAIIMLSLKYPQFNLGFSWIIRLRYGYKYNTTIAISMSRASEELSQDLPPVVTKIINLWNIRFFNAMLFHL